MGHLGISTFAERWLFFKKRPLTLAILSVIASTLPIDQLSADNVKILSIQFDN